MIKHKTNLWIVVSRKKRFSITIPVKTVIFFFLVNIHQTFFFVMIQRNFFRVNWILPLLLFISCSHSRSIWFHEILVKNNLPQIITSVIIYLKISWNQIIHRCGHPPYALHVSQLSQMVAFSMEYIHTYLPIY